MSFVNFNNKQESTQETYSIRVVKEALYLAETKNINRINKIVEGFNEPLSLNEAIGLFSDKLGAMQTLTHVKANALLVNEGQFSWFTQDTERQIGSEKRNTIEVYMYDNQGNQYREKKYEGYGEFGGMDYYELLARMNGYTEEDLEDIKGPFKELRQLGIDLAFGKIKTKDKKRKTLFPALVEDPRYSWKRHDFTQEAESDPNQSWFQDDEDDYEDDYYEDDDEWSDDYYESNMTEAQQLNEWGSSDQSTFDQAIHKDAGKPKKMPSPFDSKLRDAAESAVDFYWDDWEEYQTDRDSLIDDAVRGYLRRYFKKDFEMMQKMFEPMESVVIDEAQVKVKSFFGKSKEFEKWLKKHKVEIASMGDGVDGKDVIELVLTGKTKDLKKILASDHKFGWWDKGMWDYIEEGTILTEAKGFKNDKDFEEFLKEIDAMPEGKIRKIMGKDYIDTPGFYQDEKDNYEDVIDFMTSNMGTKEFEKLQDWWENNVAESVDTKKLTWNSLKESLGLNEGRSINKISKDHAETVSSMASTVKEWKEAEGDRKTDLLDKLRMLNKKKTDLEKELDDAVAGKDKNIQLALDEAEELAYLEKDLVEIIEEGLLSQVRSKIGKTQTALKKKWAKKGGYENFGQDEIRKLQDEYNYSSMVYGSPEERKAAALIDGLDQWAMNYIGEATISETPINEYSVNNFNPPEISRKDELNSTFFKKLMPRTSKTIKEATKRIESWFGGTMFTHVQYFEVKPNGNAEDRPTYRMHNDQYWLNDTQLGWAGRSGEKVNVTQLSVYDISDENEEIFLGRAYVDTEVYLKEHRIVFEELKRRS